MPKETDNNTTKKNTASAEKNAQTTRGQAARAVERIKLRNFFYRDGYRRLILLLVLTLALTLILAYWVVHLLLHRPEPRYFATNIQGGVVPLYPLTQPSVSTPYLLGWAARAASKAFTLNYVQYRSQLETVADTYFTPKGGQEFIKELENSNDLQAMILGKFIVTAAPNAAPQILWSGIMQNGDYKGHYAWELELPLALNIQNCAQANSRYIDIKMTIVRDAYFVDQKAVNMDGTKGIGIAQLLVKGLPQVRESNATSSVSA